MNASKLAFVGVAGLMPGLELFATAFDSLYCSMQYLAANSGRAVFPVLSDAPFTVEGVDSSSGLTTFKTAYDGVPLPPAGIISELTPPMANESGPYPVFARPLFVQIADLRAEDLTQVPVRGLEITLPAGASRAKVKRTGELPRRFGLLNVPGGGFGLPAHAAEREIDAVVGDRLIVFGSADDIAPTRELELVFNEALDYDDDPKNLARFLAVEKKEGAQWQPVPVSYRVDSNGRRVFIDLRGELQRGGEYRTIIRATLSDAAPQPKTLGVDLVLPFSVRKPHGDLLGGPFTIPDGTVRDMALDGNLLFVSATEGDLLAYDVSDPAALATKPPVARASRTSAEESPTPTDIPGETWAIAIDHHGRIWTTAQTDRFGVIRSFRVEDFAVKQELLEQVTKPVKQVAASIVSWRPGANANLPLGTTWIIQSDRAEAIPRKLQVTTQDESFESAPVDFFGNPLGAIATRGWQEGEFFVWDITVPRTPGETRFRRQRVTVENMTAKLRWSEDVLEGENFVTLSGVFARVGDRLKVMRNVGTYAVVSLLGYGLGFYDLNALEHNRRLPVAATQYAEQLALTDAKQYQPANPNRELPPCDEAAQEGGLPCGPRALTYVSDAAVVPSFAIRDVPPRFDLFGLESRKGLVDLFVAAAPGGSEAAGGITDTNARRTGHLAFTGAFNNGSDGIHNDHPRLVRIRKAFADAGRAMNSRFTGMTRFDRDGKPYALIAGSQFGLLVVQLTPPLDVHSLADVIWVPSGAYGVRHIAGTQYATAVDGEGRALLIDLSRVDERKEVAPLDLLACGMPCDTPLFPTVAQAIAAGPDPASAVRFGSDDPRIIWKSEPDLDNLYGSLAPVADPDTGFLYSGDLLEQTVRVLAGLEPRVSIVAHPHSGALKPVEAVVPLGIAPPDKVLRGGLGAFRIEVALPGSMAESAAGGTLKFRVESERVPGVAVPAPPAGWPAAHTDVTLRRVVPETNSALRYQKGWNYFVSDPVVVVADPRATKAYEPAWGGASLDEKEKAGCFSCNRPEWVNDHAETKEVYSYGRQFSIRPSPGAFTGRYAYAGEGLKLELGTIAADTVRPATVQVAGQNPPVAGGALQETTYLHSGEVETSAVDLVAGGRSGWDVAVDRTYRSRTLGWSPLGFGWDSALFKRLRVVPRGVEYRDGAEVWFFTRHPNGYFSPFGLFLKLTRDERGWALVDQQWRVTRFDDRGLVVSESDEFADATRPGSGNTIQYAYNDREQLIEVLDPAGRKTRLAYDPATGFLSEVRDWRGRTVKYRVIDGVLREVTLPAATAAEGVPAEFDHASAPPRVQYAYGAAGESFADRIELATNLAGIKDPHAVEANGAERVSFVYGEPTRPAVRDRAIAQKWATGETASFDYVAANEVVTTDALGQRRTYQLTAGGDRHMHVGKLTEHAVPLITVAETLPAAAPVSRTATAQDLVTTFESYGVHGELLKAKYPNGREINLEWKPANGGGPGKIVSAIRDYGPALLSLAITSFDYDTAAAAVNTVLSIGRAESETAPLKRRESPSPSRNRSEVVQVDDDIRQTSRYNEAGQLVSTLVEDTSTAEGESPAAPIRQDVAYYGRTSLNLYERGRPFRTSAADVAQTFTYAAVAGGGERIEATDLSRGTKTKTLLDAYGRTTSQTVVDAGGATLSDERFGYDESGRLVYHSRTQKPLGLVETRIRYDALGRELERSTNKANVNGAPVTLVEKSEFDLRARKLTRHDPAPDGESAAAREETTLDGLGRPVSVIRLAGTNGPRIAREFGYDIHGQRSYETDKVRTAVIRQHDLLGRETNSISSDGQKQTTSWSEWNEPVTTIAYDAEGRAFAQSQRILTSKGRLRAVNDELAVGGAARQTRFSWKGGRTTTSRAGKVASVSAAFLGAGPYRTEQTERDLAGRVHVTKLGETDIANALITEATKTWAQTTTTYVGATPNTIVTAEPRYGASYTTTLAHDALGRPTQVSEAGGAYATHTEYDEAGNAVALRRPGMNRETAKFDSRGLATETVLADGKALSYLYDALGNVRRRTDEAREATIYDTDVLGRVTHVRYADETFEETVYENNTGEIEATRDRGGQWLSYTYDAGGRVTAIKNGRDRATATDLVQYRYDPAGRLTLVKNKHAGLAFSNYDALGRPGVTKTYRYLGGSGLAENPAIQDVHAQKHVWSIHDGERESWRMPSAGDELPFADAASSPWLQTIVETRDAGGNLVEQKTATGDAPLLTANGRSPGRLASRKRLTPTAQEIATGYGFADGNALPPPVELPAIGGSPSVPQSGLPLWSRISIGAITLAGSANRRDDAKRLSSLRETAGSRMSGWSYDDRGRLTGSKLLQMSLDRDPIAETLLDADFRERRDAPTVLTPAQHEKLGDEAAEIERLTWTATKSRTLHQLDTRTLLLDDAVKGTRTYAFDDAGRRTGDGRWTATYDELGRLTSMTSEGEGRRIEYLYDPNNRLIGRVAKKFENDAWTPEDRATVLARDGLPADTTFVWDPIVDRLLAVYAAGASTTSGATAEAGLLRQYLHGDQGYDDPTRVLIATTPGATPTTYFPVLDESATGSLTAVLAADGTLIERVLYGDPYGDAPRYLHGPVVDRITTEIEKNQAGEIAEVNVRLHLSEAITPATLPTALRLAATRADHTPAYTSTVPPTLEDRFTALWTLNAAEWTALTTAPSATAIEVAVHRDLRAEGWGETAVMPIQAWARKIYADTDATATHPVIVRDAISGVLAFAASIDAGDEKTRTVWTVPDLYLVAVGEPKARVGVGFKGAPFVEPASGLVMLRDRWYDAATGNFLSPDPESYADSSSLYAGFKADPINNNDPTGRWVESAWDAASLGLGIYQISQWDENTSFWTKTLDVVGVGVDTAALVLPLVPGGVGAGLKAYRAGNAVHAAYETGQTTHRVLDAAQGVDQGLNVLQGSYNVAQDFAMGEVGWDTAVNALQSGIGFRSLSTRGLGGYRLDFSGGHSTASMLGTGGVRIARAPSHGRVRRQLVIGENMDRVEEYATKIGAHHYRAWENEPFDFDLAMRRNRRWIRDMKRQGFEIVDIGPDFKRRTARFLDGKDPVGPFYSMERMELRGYGAYTRVWERYGRFKGGVPGFDF